VLAILKLSRAFGKVLYIDVDIHHGDGVEEAFYYSREVITLSFHQYEPGFFPGTGKLTDVGAGKAKNHTINVPLREGITDAEYVPLFERIVQELDTKWRPSCIVMVWFVLVGAFFGQWIVVLTLLPYQRSRCVGR
jgi:acetoin utilization deacetylase AcuC-like enzyme